MRRLVKLGCGVGEGGGGFGKIEDVKEQLFKGERADRLLLFFLGWGMDPEPLLPMLGAVDTRLVWDYTELGKLSALPAGKPVHLMAWSMGVWAAGHVLGDAVPLASATAVNGTPYPIDDARGIPEAVFKGTLEGFSEAGLLRFRRRMCGGAEALKGFLEHAPKRGVEDLRAELASLGRAIRAEPAPKLRWTRALACAGDRIFPPASQLAAFPNAEQRPGAHWAPEIFARFLRGEEP